MVETWFSRDMSSRASSRGRDHVALPLEYGGKRSAPNQSPRRGNKLPWSGRLPITPIKCKHWTSVLTRLPPSFMTEHMLQIDTRDGCLLVPQNWLKA